ncbi:MAG: glycosyltransferase [Candidatus Micrarchaeia archaeon]
MEESWLRSGPRLQDLESERRDDRGGRRNDAAVVITTYGNNKMLSEHLERLREQTSRDFDVVIIYGEKDPFLGPLGWAGALHIRERGRNGCAGAYYLGEKAALAEGYSVLFLADNDCFPQTPRLIEEALGAIGRGEKVVIPHQVSLRNGSRWTLQVPHYYGALHKSVFQEAGLTYLPLYFGGDDVEFMGRIVRSGFSAKYIDEAVSHPPLQPFIIDDSQRRYYYTRGELEALILGGGFFRTYAFCLVYLLAAAALFAVGKKSISGYIATGIWDGSGMRFFRAGGGLKNDLEKGGAGGAAPERFEPDFVFDSARETPEGFVGPNMLLHMKRKNTWSGIFGHLATASAFFLRFPRFLGKRILFEGWNNAIVMPPLLMARSAMFRHDGRDHIIFRDRGMPSVILGMMFVFVSVLPIMILSGMLAARGFFRRWSGKIISQGYGLGKTAPGSDFNANKTNSDDGE